MEEHKGQEPNDGGGQAAPLVRMITLESPDGELFELSDTAAKLSGTVNELLGDDAQDDDMDGESHVVPLMEVTGPILAKVVEYCMHYEKDEMPELERPLKSRDMSENTSAWYAQYLQGMDQDTLHKVCLAAHYMDIKPLLELTCAAVALPLKGKSPEDIRSCFNIVRDLSPEEEAQVREANQWCEQD